MVRMRGSIRAITRARNSGDTGRRYAVWRGGSIASSMSRICSRLCGSRFSITTPPSLAEKISGCLATWTTSAWRSTAQYPGSSSIGWNTTGCSRRSRANNSWGAPCT